MKYIAITIGPIVETLLNARRTAELWASSYMFSYIMKNIVDEINKNKELADVILPVVISSDTDKKNGAGLYPDRIYMPAPNGEIDLKEVKEIIDAVIKEFSDKSKINDEEFLKSFFKIYTIMVEIKENENIVEILSTYCDSAELQNRILPKQVEDEKNPLLTFFKNINKSKLLEDAFGKTKDHFDFLLEIATREFKNDDPDKYEKLIHEVENSDKESKEEIDDEALLIEKFKKDFSQQFMARHKYFAFVHADGDNIGKIIKEVGTEPKKLKVFSEKLSKFSLEATNLIIDEFDGMPIYMGGDDMLFLAPVCNKKDKDCHTIFHLIEKLDKLFSEIIIKYAKEKLNLQKSPSMSYGLAINYYREPIYEVRNDSYALLEEVKQNIPNKNSVNVNFQKHSGQQIKFTISKDNNEYELFTKLISKEGVNYDNFLNSFTHKIDSLKPFLIKIIGDKERLKAFFEHNFNENYKSNKGFFIALESFIYEIRHKVSDTEKQNKENKEKDPNSKDKNEFDLLYGALRFLHFINSKDKE